MATTVTSTSVVTQAGIAAAIRYGSVPSGSTPSYGAKLQVSRIVVGSTQVSNLNQSMTSVPNVVWDSRNPNDNPYNPSGSVPMSFLQYQAVSDSVMAFCVNLPESAGPFDVATVGLYARDETGADILFSVSQYNPVVQKIATTEVTTGYSQSYWIFIALAGISKLFTEDGKAVVHPDPIMIDPINNSYATIPSVPTEAKLPLPATNSIYNIYHIENITEYGAPGLAIRAGVEWNYMPSWTVDSGNSFACSAALLDGSPNDFYNKVVYLNAVGKFSKCDGTQQPIGVYKDGRIYVSSGLVLFTDLPQNLTIGATYYSTLDGDFSETSTGQYVVGRALSQDSMIIDFTDNRAPTETQFGKPYVATLPEVVDGTNNDKMVTPYTLSQMLISQDNPEAAINAYFGCMKEKNISISRVPRTDGNEFDLKVSAYLPRLVGGVGIRQELVEKTYTINWRRNPLDYPAGDIVTDASYEATPVAMDVSWSWAHRPAYDELRTQSGQSYLNPDNMLQIGDYIYVGGAGGPDAVRKIIQINETTTYTGGAITSIQVYSGLRDMGAMGYYYFLKDPVNLQFFQQYIKFYWKEDANGIPQVDFDFITSMARSMYSTDYALPDDWNDNNDKFVTGNLLRLGLNGTKNKDSYFAMSSGYCYGEFSKYKIGEVVTVAANPKYLPDGTIQNLNSLYCPCPETGMTLADGAPLNPTSDLYKEYKYEYLPNFRTYIEEELFAAPIWTTNITDSRTSTAISAPPGSENKKFTAPAANSVCQVQLLHDAMVYIKYAGDRAGTDNIITRIVRNGTTYTVGGQHREHGGNCVVGYMLKAKKGDFVQALSPNTAPHATLVIDFYTKYAQFNPGTLTWVKTFRGQ